jgi:hypothetical protein
LVSAAPRFAADALMVGRQIIRRDSGADHDHRVGRRPADPPQEKTLNGADHKR